MNPIRVHLQDRSYNIQFGTLSSIGAALRKLGLASSKKLIVTTRALEANGHLKTLTRSLKSIGPSPASHVLPNGEAQKNLTTVSRLYHAGFATGLDRKSVVVALGGGVVTDMAGFFAATYMRGIPFVSIPTTLLGMVDAAIGGKTGVDVAQGKNLVGAFWQPKIVWIDPAVLRTLPRREWVTGIAETLKYGVILDKRFFESLERQARQAPDVSRWSASLIAQAIRASARMKAAVVSADERETPLKGGREILNFGHTAGHALEAASQYRLSHGEAISVGMAVAGEIALRRKMWSHEEHERMIHLLRRFGLPINFPTLSAKARSAFWAALQNDKKHVSGKLRFVLPTKIGKVVVVSGIPREEVKKACSARGLVV